MSISAATRRTRTAVAVHLHKHIVGAQRFRFHSMNPLVNAFGGREGCLGSWYSPTMRELLEERNDDLRSAARRLERQQQRLTATNTKLVNEIRQYAQTKNPNKVLQAKQKALDLNANRVEFSRLGSLRGNVTNIQRQLAQELQAVEIDRSLRIVVRVMQSRLMNAEQFTQTTIALGRLKNMEEVNDDQLTEHFADDLQHGLERANDDTSSDAQLADAIFRELGIDVLQNTVLPSVPINDPNNNRGSAGNDFTVKAD